MVATKVFYEDKVIEGERLELTDKNSIYSLGPNLSLNDCTIVLSVPAKQFFTDRARFTHCTFEVKRELKNYQDWVFSSLKGCRFKGRLSGCDFGCWPGYSAGSEHGFIEDCDFSEAQMDGCRIMGCDPRTIQFPRWPCFTILDPIGRAPELRGVQWPGRFGSVVIEELHTDPSCTKALIFHAPTVAKQLGTTPEALKAVIERFDFILH